jgi:hypothetical protein
MPKFRAVNKPRPPTLISPAVSIAYEKTVPKVAKDPVSTGPVTTGSQIAFGRALSFAGRKLSQFSHEWFDS